MNDFTAGTAASGASPGGLESSLHELQRAAAALARRPPPEERAALAGALLGAAGWLLRRSLAVQTAGLAPPSALDELLLQLPREDLHAWLAGASSAGLLRALRQAQDDAFEAALAEAEDEQDLLLRRATEGLAERDHLASQLHAVARFQQLAGPLDDRARRRLDALRDDAARIDRSLRPGSVALASLNETRRAHRDLLDEPLRADAWWYSHLADRDDLASLPFSSSPPDTASPRVAQAFQNLHTPPSRHLSGDELWDLEMGLLDPNQRAWVHRHALSCADCKQLLQALADGEEAIHEALGQASPRPQVEIDHEVVFEHPQFRVLAFSSKKPRLVLEEKRPGALADAQPLAGVKPRRVRNGFEFQLPPRHREPLRMRVTLTSGEELTVPVG
ncbi:MAG: hypothetical protein MUF64_06110 [Polyangiaceae bacterium]|nr:hypothetical protein [Polyangiaceae bacterium]